MGSQPFISDNSHSQNLRGFSFFQKSTAGGMNGRSKVERNPGEDLMTISGRNCKTVFHEMFVALVVLCRIVMAAGETREAWPVMRLSGIRSP
jgi:hypothetical protein